jgi:hypothetical protein
MVEIVSGGYWEVDDMVCGVCEGECSGCLFQWWCR